MDLSEDSVRERERYAAKEREKRLLGEREKEELLISKARQQVMKQIADDRK